MRFVDPVAVNEAGQAAQSPSPAPVSAAENALPTKPVDSPTEEHGRRLFSTAFVRIGPDGHLTVDLRDGRALVLRNVIMNAGNFCGIRVTGGPVGKRYCGAYADVVAARPGGAPVTRGADLAGPRAALPSGSAVTHRHNASGTPRK